MHTKTPCDIILLGQLIKVKIVCNLEVTCNKIAFLSIYRSVDLCLNLKLKKSREHWL